MACICAHTHIPHHLQAQHQPAQHQCLPASMLHCSLCARSILTIRISHRAPAVCAHSRLCFAPLTCAHTTGRRPRDRPPCSQAQAQAVCTRQEPWKGVVGSVQAGNYSDYFFKQVQTPRAAASPARTPASMAAPKTKTPKIKAVPEEVWSRQNLRGFFVYLFSFAGPCPVPCDSRGHQHSGMTYQAFLLFLCITLLFSWR